MQVRLQFTYTQFILSIHTCSIYFYLKIVIQRGFYIQVVSLEMLRTWLQNFWKTSIFSAGLYYVIFHLLRAKDIYCCSTWHGRRPPEWVRWVYGYMCVCQCTSMYVLFLKSFLGLIFKFYLFHFIVSYLF